MTYDYTVSIDFGTTTTAWAVREGSSAQSTAYSPVTDAQIEEETFSDLYFYLNSD